MKKTAGPRVLLVEDSESLAAVYQEYLSSVCSDVSHVMTGKEACALLLQQHFDLLLLDLHLPDMHGLDILRMPDIQALKLAVVIITAHGSLDLAVEAMRYGALDFIEKPFSSERLRTTVTNATAHRQLSALVDDMKEVLDRTAYYGFVGASLAMQGVYRMIESAAPSKATVFITGESGTGKEVCADAIHRASPRNGQPFIALNCAAIPKDLMESEIFGHVKGAFTGAVKERDGAAAQAHGGTLFLDEVCEMDLELQSKLLRFLQTGSFQRVGGTKIEHVDVRFVCATNKDPLAEVQKGSFREDLYYRLHVIPIHLPPLRERDDDIVRIAKSFLLAYSEEEGRGFKGFTPEVLSVFMAYEWPGNIRQLQNVIRNIVVLNSGEQVTLPMLPSPLNQISIAKKALSVEGAKFAEKTVSVNTNVEPMNQMNVIGTENPLTQKASELVEQIRSGRIAPLWQLEKTLIETAINYYDGNIPRAAAALEISASTIYRKKQAWESME